LVASDDPVLLDEIVRFLEEIPHWRLAPSVRSADELASAVASSAPDAILVTDGFLLKAQGVAWGRSRTVVIGRRDDANVLRTALKLGARGFVKWPDERRELRALVESGLAAHKTQRSPRGSVTALWSPKGGSGSSVIAAHLAAALAGLGSQTLLVDLDLDHGDISAILSADDHARTILDLLRVIDELTPSVVESVAWKHPAGFGVVRAPGAAGESGLVKPAEVARLLAAMREVAKAVVVDLPSGFQELSLVAALEADRLLLIVTPDVLSLRRAKSAAAALNASGFDSRSVAIVLNQSGASAEISPSDVEAVVGRRIAARIRPDAGLARSPDRGQLADTGRKLLDPLARTLFNLPPAQTTGLRRLFARPAP
jgi:pilus assembly protein CpaE